MALEKEEQRHVTAAEGFLELGMFTDADAELDRIYPICRHLPEVLEVRAKVYHACEKWELLEAVTKRLWDATGETSWCAEWAHALRQSGALESAKASCSMPSRRIPTTRCFTINSRATSVGWIRESRQARLEHAIKLDPALRMRALGDPDLAEIWP